MDLRRSQRHRFATVTEVLDKVKKLQLMCERMPELYGYRSSDITRYQRKLIALTNSLSIIFLQYDLYCESYNLLKLAAITDLQLHASGDMKTATWTGRIVTYNCFAFLFENALKFIYKAQSILLSAQNNAVRIPGDIGLATNLVTFLLLWKVKKYHEAYGYAQICSSRVKKQGQGIRSGTAYRTYLNLTGIIVMAVAGCYLKVEKDNEKATRTLENVLLELRDWDIPVVRLMMEMLGEVQRISDESDTSFEATGEVRDMRLPESVFLTQDFLATSEYLSLVFITVFLPFISTPQSAPTTPLIRRADLEDSRRREPTIHSSERSDEFLRILSSQSDSYVTTMNGIVSGAKHAKDPEPSPIRLVSKVRNKAAERIRKYRRQIDPRRVHDFTRDWTTAQFHAPKFVVPRLDQRHDSLPPSKVSSHFSSPRRKIVTEKQLLLTKRRANLSTDPKKHIMVEFTPSRLAQDNESVPVDVVPMATSRAEVRLKKRKRRVIRGKNGGEREGLDRTMRIERQEGVSISPREDRERTLNVSVL